MATTMLRHAGSFLSTLRPPSNGGPGRSPPPSPSPRRPSKCISLPSLGLSLRRNSTTCQSGSEEQLTRSLCELSKNAWVGRSVEALQRILEVRASREVFMEFLKTQYSEENLLFWIDVEAMRHASGPELKAKAEAILDCFVRPGSNHEVNIDSKTRKNLIGIREDTHDEEEIREKFVQAQYWVLHMMAVDCLPRFLDSAFYPSLMAGMVGEGSPVRSLQSLRATTKDQCTWLERFIHVCDIMPFSLVISGVAPNAAGGDSFCIVHVNPEFTKTTGFTQEDVVNRNCRFLQGPETEPEAVQLIRNALSSHQPLCVRVTNYRKTGEKFVNLLSIRPVFDRKKKKCQHFIAMQFDITHYDEARIAALGPILQFLPEEIWV